MADILTRVAHDLVGRLDGPMHFRFFMQPAMSIFFAIRDGIHDAKQNKSAYLWTVCSDAAHRRDLLRDGWKGVSRVFLFAVVLDAIYQITEFHTFYIGEALITATLLALIPYALLRGPVNRLARHFLGTSSRPARQE